MDKWIPKSLVKWTSGFQNHSSNGQVDSKISTCPPIRSQSEPTMTNGSFSFFGGSNCNSLLFEWGIKFFFYIKWLPTV